jgi:hypothetical protein
MIFGPAKIVGRSILGCVCQHASEVNCDTKVATAGIATGSIRASRNGQALMAPAA